ncbi:MAG: VOC family protein [Phycisphaerales bacterium]|nr:VOC family protein [Phycisphaerales bacterium]
MTMKLLVTVTTTVIVSGFAGCTSNEHTDTNHHTGASSMPQPAHGTMPIGAFSVSLAVKDIHASKAFYEALGFEEAGGNISQNWVVLRNGTTTIGLFQGMFDMNIMTFNPGWTHAAQPLDSFMDVREIQKSLKNRGITLTTEADENSTGVANFTLIDPDGNMILFDQHVPKPGS